MHMGIGCVLLMWTTGAIGGALIAFIGAFILTSGLRSKSGVRISIGGVLTSGGAITALLAIVFLVSWVIFGGGPRSSTSPAAFKSEFGFAPAGDVRDIRSEMSDSTDSAIHYLRFRASPATIAASRIDASNRRRTRNANVPSGRRRRRNGGLPAIQRATPHVRSTIRSPRTRRGWRTTRAAAWRTSISPASIERFLTIGTWPFPTFNR